MTTLTSIHRGHDVAYFTRGSHAGSSHGAMSYYTKSGELPGVWSGSAAASLGLCGEVGAKDIENLYMHSVSPSGERLRAPLKKKDAVRAPEIAEAYRQAHPLAAAGEVAEAVSAALGKTGPVKVPYYDVTVSAVKSISVLWAALKVEAATCGDEVLADELNAEADGIEADLLASAELAVSKAEELACYTRTGHHSKTTGEYRDGKGLVRALFPHQTSRDGDPQLHIHIPIGNLVQRADGADDKWRALDGRELYKQRLMIAAYTDREMERRMIARGYAMIPREDGNGAEIGGVSQDVMSLFSSRSRHLSPELMSMIDAYVDKYGEQPSKRTIWAMGQEAAKQTRRAKAQAKRMAGGEVTSKEVSPAERFEAWEKQAELQETGALLLVRPAVREFAENAPPLAELDQEGMFRAARIAVHEVQQHHAVFGMPELAFEVNRALPVGSSLEDIDDVGALAISGFADTEVIEVTAPDVVDASSLGVRKDGTSIFRRPNERLFTTAGQIDLEETIVRLAGKKVDPLVSEGQALEVLKDTNLTDEQLAAVVQLLTSPDAVKILTAPAGAGKTFSLAAFSQAWMSLTGNQVIGLATSQNAALEMSKAGCSSTYNTAAFLGKVKGSDELRYPVALHEGDVLLLDESSQLSTRDLALIMQAADRAGARVIPTGDMEQLGAVEAGGMVRHLADILGVVELTEVLRFADEWEREASLRLRLGDKKVLAAYNTRGRIQGFDRERAYLRAAGAYLADHLRGKDTLLLAGSNAEAAELSSLVQRDLVKMGLVQTPCVDLSDGNRAGVGDLVRARMNSRINADGRELTNRDVLKIDAISGDAVQARRLLPDGRWSAAFDLSAEYRVNNVELGYAGNVHVAQGKTVDIAHLLATDTLSKEALYVAQTRGREGNYAWAVTGETAKEGAKPFGQATPEAVLSGIMDRSSRELSASEQIKEALEWSSGIGHVLNLWSAATKNVVEASIEEHLRNYLLPADFERYQKEPSRMVLHQALRERQVSGQGLKMVLASITSEGLEGARSISSVLHHRLGSAPAFAGSWETRTPEGSPEVAKEAAAVLDSRQRELGLRLLSSPEPWLIAHLSVPPGDDASPTLHEDYISKAGRAAAYREAAGITNPHQAVALSGHEVPEIEAMRQDTIRALEIRDEDALVRAASKGELEAKVLQGERVQVHAPADLSPVLRLTSLAERDSRQQEIDSSLAGKASEAEGARQLADALADKKAALEPQQRHYESWSEETTEVRSAAEKARAELTRRGEAEVKPQSSVDWWKDFEVSVEKASQALELEREARTSKGLPWPPAREAEIDAGMPLPPDAEMAAKEEAEV